MSAKHRRDRKVMTQIEISRKLNWRMTQRAHSKGLIYDPISGRLFVRPQGWWPKSRHKIRLQIATYFSTHPPVTVPSVGVEAQKKE